MNAKEKIEILENQVEKYEREIINLQFLVISLRGNIMIEEMNLQKKQQTKTGDEK